MRIADYVIDRLTNCEELGRFERSLYLLACALEPSSIIELAELSCLSRNIVARACKNLAKLG